MDESMDVVTVEKTEYAVLQSSSLYEHFGGVWYSIPFVLITGSLNVNVTGVEAGPKTRGQPSHRVTVDTLVLVNQ
jgi:hypothetical protein